MSGISNLHDDMLIPGEQETILGQSQADVETVHRAVSGRPDHDGER